MTARRDQVIARAITLGVGILCGIGIGIALAIALLVVGS